MAFPLTHLVVAERVLAKHGVDDKSAAQFLLGSISPDAVHFRKEFMGTTMSNIGATKKITHLCPISDEKWGHITDNNGWIDNVQVFLCANAGDPFAAGIAVHVLTDIWNNKTLWHDFVTNFPDESAKGYNSEYYDDLRNIDLRVYNELYTGSVMEQLFSCATPHGFAGLVETDELAAMRDSLLNKQYKNVPANPSTDYSYLTYQQMLNFIDEAAEFCASMDICYN